MYAIVDIAGQQFKVEKGKKIFVHRLTGDEGTVISFDKVLLIGNDDKVSVGTPYVNKAVVTAQILTHLRGDKIQVFKKKRRKGYQVLNGHRQHLTEILIDEISESGMVSKTGTSKEAVPKNEDQPQKTSGAKKEQQPQKSAEAVTKETSTVKPSPAASTTEKKVSKPEAGKEGAKAAKETPAAKSTATKKPAAKKAPASSEKAKKPVSKAASIADEDKSKPAAKKASEKKPAEKKK